MIKIKSLKYNDKVKKKKKSSCLSIDEYIYDYNCNLKIYLIFIYIVLTYNISSTVIYKFITEWNTVTMECKNGIQLGMFYYYIASRMLNKKRT